MNKISPLTASRAGLRGLVALSLGLAMAGAAFHRGIMAGKLKGPMMPTTPSGCRIEYTSTPVDTDSE